MKQQEKKHLQQNYVEPVSFHTYLKRYVHLAAKQNKYVVRITKDAIEQWNRLVNDFIIHVTRCAIKIAQENKRHTLLERDIDTVFFILLSPQDYRHANYDFRKSLKSHKKFMENPYSKKPATMGEKYDLPSFSASRIMLLMRRVDPKMRYSEHAVIRVASCLENIFNSTLKGMILKCVVREKDGIKYTKNIQWKVIHETIANYIHTGVSFCRFLQN